MLVLSRKPGQSFIIGENIVVTVNRIDGEQVKIGISAPRDIQITRSELLDQRQDAGDQIKKEFER